MEGKPYSDDQTKQISEIVADIEKSKSKFELLTTAIKWVGRCVLAWIIMSGATTILTQNTENLSLVQRMIESFAQIINARFSILIGVAAHVKCPRVAL